jgi:hypothetical protein
MSIIFYEILCKNDMMRKDLARSSVAAWKRPPLPFAGNVICQSIPVAGTRASGLVLKIAMGRRMIAATHNHPEW